MGAGDGYSVSGDTITVSMAVSEPGDWIRVITAGTGVVNTAPEFGGTLYGLPNFGWVISLAGGLLGFAVIRRVHSS